MTIGSIYGALLHLYPGDYAAFFADEMKHTFEKACKQRRRQGWVALGRFATKEWVGLVIGAGAEWVAKLGTDDSIRGRVLPDLRKMRPVGVPKELWFASGAANSGQKSLPLEVGQAQERVTFLVNRIVDAIAHHDFQAARSYSYEEQKERENLRNLRKKHGLDA